MMILFEILRDQGVAVGNLFVPDWILDVGFLHEAGAFVFLVFNDL